MRTRSLLYSPLKNKMPSFLKLLPSDPDKTFFKIVFLPLKNKKHSFLKFLPFDPEFYLFFFIIWPLPSIFKFDPSFPRFLNPFPIFQNLWMYPLPSSLGTYLISKWTTNVSIKKIVCLVLTASCKYL